MNTHTKDFILSIEAWSIQWITYFDGRFSLGVGRRKKLKAEKTMIIFS